MKESDWNDLKVNKIALTNSEDADIVFITFDTIEDAARMTSLARNLPQTNQPNDPRFVMFIDPRAKKRYNAIQNIAKTVRTKSDNQIQTTVRNGKRDFLLRQKTRGDQTPWSQIPPILLEEQLPQFEIGLFKNIFDETNEDDDQIEDDNTKQREEETEALNDLSKEIQRQYEEDEERLKRTLSHQSQSFAPPSKVTKKQDIQPAGSQSDNDADTESDSGQKGNHEMSRTVKTVLHSTLKSEDSSSNHQEEFHGFSIPETPTSPKHKLVTRYNSEQLRNRKQFPKTNEKIFKPICEPEIGQYHG